MASLSSAERAFLEASRRAVLGTVGARWPRLVPVCFALIVTGGAEGEIRLYSAIDEKPKRSPDPAALGRVRDIARSPLASLLVDRWDEDWSRLAWLRVDGSVLLLAPDSDMRGEHRQAVGALRDRYAQYETQALEARPIIRITVEHIVSWGL